MRISEFIRHLQEVMELQGDIEVVRVDGKPFSYIAVEEQTPKKHWRIVVTEEI